MKESIEKIVAEFKSLTPQDQVVVFNEVKKALLDQRSELREKLMTDQEKLASYLDEVKCGSDHIATGLDPRSVKGMN